MCQAGKGFWHQVQWDGKAAVLSPLGETDERHPHGLTGNSKTGLSSFMLASAVSKGAMLQLIAG
jgi:hypothetical protein